MFTYVTTYFKQVYWLTGLWLLVGSLMAFFLVLPNSSASIGSYLWSFWLPIFMPVLLLCGLSLLAIVDTIKRRRVWWGTLGYLVLTCIACVYGLLAFLFVTFSLFGFS